MAELSPSDAAEACARRIKEALDRLGGLRLISLDLVSGVCTAGDHPVPVNDVMVELVKLGCSVFCGSTVPGAYRREIEAGRAPNRNMLEAALAGKPWPPPAPPEPPPVPPTPWRW